MKTNHLQLVQNDTTQTESKSMESDINPIGAIFESLLKTPEWDEGYRLTKAGYYIHDALMEDGTFISANLVVNGEVEVDYDEVYWMDKKGRAVSVTSEKFLYKLSNDFQIQIKRRTLSSQAFEVFKAYAHKHAKLVTKHNTVYWDPQKKMLYKYNGDGNMYVLDGQSIKIQPNGYHGVFFTGKVQSFQYTVASNAQEREALLLRLFEGNFNEENMTPSDASLILMYWFYSLFFISELKARPIMILYGPQRSGKTTVLTNLYKMILGTLACPTTMKSKVDDLYAYVSSRDLCFFDNADGNFSDDVMDIIAAITSGTTYSRRKLYTTNDLYEVLINTVLSFTTRTANMRSDVIDRSLLLYTKPINETSGNTLVVDDSNWDELQSALLDKLNHIVGILRNTTTQLASTKIRMYDWGNFVFRINPTDFASIEHSISNVQDGALEENSEFAELLSNVIHEYRLQGEIVNKNLSELMAAYQKKLGVRNPITSSSQISKQIKNNLKVLQLKGHVLTPFQKKDKRGWNINPIQLD